jgi:tRNA pseudouridine synthase 10
MDVLEKALRMLEKRPLCDHCLGRQFAMLGHGMENTERGQSTKTVLLFNAQTLAMSGDRRGIQILKLLATHGFSQTAKQVLHKTKKRIPKKNIPKMCFLCEDKFKNIRTLAEKAVELLEDYEYNNFLVGVELPVAIAEREDEFKAEFDVTHGENMRNEFGRLTGKAVAEHTGKEVEFRKPDIVVLINPFAGQIWLQVNPLFVAGRYRKLVRDIPQSKWFCGKCRGRGCKACDWTGKLYPESVEEIVEKPFLDATEGLKGSFHASGREDIDARMLGNGRPFVVEITKPKKRFLNLKELQKAVNTLGKNKVEVSSLAFADRDDIRILKKGEHKQKEYLVTIEFENKITAKDTRMVEQKLSNSQIHQKTPTRVMHRRADLTREKYIYDVKVKKLSPHRAEMKIRCAGGLYVKELVSGDEGRTTPSVTEILNNKAKPMKLDVLNVIMGDQDEVEK